MTKIEVDLQTTCPPSGVVEALTDFTDRRPQIWSGLAPRLYEVYAVGETTAEVREGSSKPIMVWARERYDWSTPGTVTWTVVESNFCTAGSGVSITAMPGANGGSRVHLRWERWPSNARGRVAMVVMRLFGRKILSTYCRTSLDAYATARATA